MTRSAVALARLAAPPDPTTSDAHLLHTFVASQGEDEFAELVRRHGPMVFAICRRILSDADDAEDAFQAVFLVLARKAASIRGTNLAGWLYGVAVRTARGVRVMRDRRRKHSVRSQESGDRNQKAGTARTPDTHLLVAEQAAVIDEELAKLPEHYRDAIILCELRGLSRKQAAAELGILEGTLSSRLAGAKRKLAAALTRRGVAIPVTLTAILASAPVSAALLESTATVIRGAAGNVAHLAAATVLKGMLFDQLKAVVLATGLLLTVVCGGLAMTGAADAPKSGSTSATGSRLAPDPAAKLVAQLASEEFTEREAAHKELRALGLKAEPALKAGLKSDDPEVRARCAKILVEIRQDALDALAKSFDPTADDDPDHPLWRRFKAVAGDTRDGRFIFAQFLADPRLARLLDAAEANPAERARIYRDEVTRRSCDVLYAVADQMPGGYRLLSGGPKASELKPPPEPVTTDTLAAYFFLGSYPETAVAVDGKDRAGRPVREGLIVETWVFDKSNPQRHVVRKLFAAWLDNRVDRDTLESAYGRATNNNIPDAALAARRLLAAEKLPVEAKAYAAVYLARCGKRSDVSLITPLLDDATVARAVIYDKPAPVQVRDAALAACLLLHGQNPADYGFDILRKRGGAKEQAFDMAWLGFWTDESRDAAHKKGKAFLDKQEK